MVAANFEPLNACRHPVTAAAAAAAAAAGVKEKCFFQLNSCYCA